MKISFIFEDLQNAEEKLIMSFTETASVYFSSDRVLPNNHMQCLITCLTTPAACA